jgi:hypothetical protein
MAKNDEAAGQEIGGQSQEAKASRARLAKAHHLREKCLERVISTKPESDLGLSAQASFLIEFSEWGGGEIVTPEEWLKFMQTVADYGSEDKEAKRVNVSDLQSGRVHPDQSETANSAVAEAVERFNSAYAAWSEALREADEMKPNNPQKAKAEKAEARLCEAFHNEASELATLKPRSLDEAAQSAAALLRHAKDGLFDRRLFVEFLETLENSRVPSEPANRETVQTLIQMHRDCVQAANEPGIGDDETDRRSNKAELIYKKLVSAQPKSAKDAVDLATYVASYEDSFSETAATDVLRNIADFFKARR